MGATRRGSLGTIADASAGADNFTLLRHLAAVGVLYGHSFDLAARTGGRGDLIAAALPGFKAGSLSVYVFFAISGYLVTLSLIRNPSLWRYLRHRLLRVFPAYFACLLVCVFAVGLVFTTQGIPHYLSNAETWRFLAENLFPVRLQWSLPGVFQANPFPNVVNGALWSLGLEVRWYGYLALLAVVGVAGRRWAFTLLAAGLLALGLSEIISGDPDPHYYRGLSMTFVIAALAAHWRTLLRIGHGAMAVLAALTLAVSWAWGSAVLMPLMAVSVVGFALWFAYAAPILPWPPRRDYSYGLFLYGFPVQQSLLAVWPALTPLTLFVLASAVTLMLAALSWHWIEAPLLPRHRARADASAPPVPVVAAAPG